MIPRRFASISAMSDLTRYDSVLIGKKNNHIPGKCTNLQTLRFSGDHPMCPLYFSCSAMRLHEKVEQSLSHTCSFQRLLNQSKGQLQDDQGKS